RCVALGERASDRDVEFSLACRGFSRVKPRKSPGLNRPEVRKEEAVKRHFRLSCVAQSLVQRAACSGGKSERFEFSDEKASVGQKVYPIAREALAGVLQLAQGLFAQGRTCDQVLEVLMPG